MQEARAESLHDLFSAARAAWPGVELSIEAFSRHVIERAAEPRDLAAITALETGDLYLACACTVRAPGALETLERALLAQVPRMVASIDPTGQLGEDVRQRLRERLLLGRNDDGRARIATYHGRGTLLAWLRVSASRIACDLLNERRQRAEVPIDDELGLVAGSDGELELIKRRYKQELEDAVAEALRDLPHRERTMMRLHLVSGISTHKLGAMFHVDQSTIARALAGARRAVRAATRARLAERLRLSGSALDSLIALLVSRVDLSLGGCLQSNDAV